MGINTTVIPSRIDVDNTTIEKTGTIINIKNNGVDTNQIKDNAVTANKIANGSVTTAKLNASIMSLVSSHSFSANQPQWITTGLDLDSDNFYKIFVELSANANSGRSIYLKLNDSVLVSDSIIAGLSANTQFNFEITIFPNTASKRKVVVNMVNSGGTGSVTYRYLNSGSNISKIEFNINGIDPIYLTSGLMAIYKIPKA